MSTPPGDTEGRRPPVTVIVPFAGDAAEAAGVVSTLESLHSGPDDELVIVDNTAGGVVGRESTHTRVTVLPAAGERSSYHARNAAARRATTEWLLFFDADCRPVHPALLDRFFDTPPGPECGAVAGAVLPQPGQRATVARFAASRQHLDQAVTLRHPHLPFASTAHLMVRREAWEAVGGFCEGIRSAGDQDLCWRIQQAGWTLDYRESAAVEHRHRETVRALARQWARYGAGSAWLHRRHRGPSMRPELIRGLARSFAGAAIWLLAGRREAAIFKLLDGVVIGAHNLGGLLDNRPPQVPDQGGSSSPAVCLVVREFPPRRARGRAHSSRLLRRSSPEASGPGAMEGARRRALVLGGRRDPPPRSGSRLAGGQPPGAGRKRPPAPPAPQHRPGDTRPGLASTLPHGGRPGGSARQSPTGWELSTCPGPARSRQSTRPGGLAGR